MCALPKEYDDNKIIITKIKPLKGRESTELCELVDWHNVLVANPPSFEVASSKHYIILCSLFSFSYIIIICHLSELKPTSFANFCLQARTLSWTDVSWTSLTF